MLSEEQLRQQKREAQGIRDRYLEHFIQRLIWGERLPYGRRINQFLLLDSSAQAIGVRMHYRTQE